MNIFIYSDESGTFDYQHFDHFVYGGVIFLSHDVLDNVSRKYKSIEDEIRNENGLFNEEIKASILKNKEKRRLLGCINSEGCFPFGIVINLKKIKQKNIFDNSKSKQRYMDYAYKIGLKSVLKEMISQNMIDKNKFNTINIFADEHSSATDGRYELREALDQEFNSGTYNYNYDKYFEPVFPNHNCTIKFKFQDSKQNVFIRLSDIVANYIYHKAIDGKLIECNDKIFKLTILP